MWRLETMAGKGSEIGRTFEELARIYDGVKYSDKLRVCFDTCHTSDSGYDIIHHFDDVIEEFDRIIGKDQIAVFHINDSKNVPGAAKDRHENIGSGHIGFEAIIISFTCRILGMFRKYLRRHIYHLWKIQRNHMLLINMKLRCFGQGNLILI